MTRPLAALAALLCALGLAACNGAPGVDGVPEELSKADGAALTDARAGLNDAIEAVGVLRSSPVRARRTVGRVRRVIAGGALEARQLDEFGLAALGELRLVVPSLVEYDEDGVQEDLDRPALRAYLTYAQRDPVRALLLPARQEVEAIERVIRRSGAGPQTRVPDDQLAASMDLRVEGFLREAEANAEKVWPDLGERLRRLRGGISS